MHQLNLSMLGAESFIGLLSLLWMAHFIGDFVLQSDRMAASKRATTSSGPSSAMSTANSPPSTVMRLSSIFS